MKNKIKILVTGATGNQGGAVIKELKKYDVEIHALTRNPQSKVAKKLFNQGVILVKADLGNIDSLWAIKDNYDFVFFITDFWAGKEQEISFGRNLIEILEKILFILLHHLQLKKVCFHFLTLNFKLKKY